MKMITIILFAAAMAPAVFSSEVQYPPDNASEIVPPHSQRGNTYAKGDPFDRIIHGYDMVDLDIVWKTTRDDRPPLEQELDRILG